MKVDVNRPLYVIAFTVLVTAGFTAAITALQAATAGKVQRNEVLREERALVKVFGLGDVAKMTPDEITATVRRRIVRGETLKDPQTGREIELIRAYKAEPKPGARRAAGDLQAVAFPLVGVGFWAKITALMALTPDYGKVVGMVVLDQSETPGLGGRIVEPWFQDQFKNLDVAPPKEGGKFVYMGGGKPSGPSDPRYGRSVDAITGATQTSLAVGKLLNENLAQFRRAVASAAAKP